MQVHYIHKNGPSVNTILSQLNPIIPLKSILISFSPPRCVSQVISPPRSPTKFHRILLNCISPLICGGQHKPHRFALRSVFNIPRTSFRLETNFLLSILSSNKVQLHLSRRWWIRISMALRVHSSRILQK